MNRWGLIIGSFLAVGLLSGFWLLKSNLKYRNSMVLRGVPRDISEEELAEIAKQVREEAEPSPRPGSRVRVENNEHDFGTASAFSGGQIDFEIHNTGTVPLALGDPKSDSLAIDLASREIEPGLSTIATVTWETGPDTRYMRASATIPTSDPDKPAIKLHVRGKVVRWIDGWPKQTVEFPSIRSGEKPKPRNVFVFSREWESFQIAEISAGQISEEGGEVTWQSHPMTAEELAEHEAQSGYRIEVHVPYDLPSATYGTDLTVLIEPPPSHTGAVPHARFSLRWHVYRRFCLYSEAFSKPGLMDLGVIPQGTSKSATIRVKVRDELAELPGARFETEPSFVNVKMVPQHVGDGIEGNYVIHVEIPEDAPQSLHLRSDQFGKIRFFSDHPRIPEQMLQVRFAVVKPKRPDDLP